MIRKIDASKITNQLNIGASVWDCDKPTNIKSKQIIMPN
jgi:hypothetical protein